MVANAGISAMIDLLSGLWIDSAPNLAYSFFHAETLEGWDRMMRINATSAFLCYKYAAIQMIKQGHGGRIIGASSMVGIQGKRLRLSLICV
jgi:NAD(P)-dependent dehydrogenase (short-subunit alcohol dehydrogenase family)